jgi:hypothetical protein
MTKDHWLSGQVIVNAVVGEAIDTIAARCAGGDLVNVFGMTATFVSRRRSASDPKLSRITLRFGEPAIEDQYRAPLMSLHQAPPPED